MYKLKIRIITKEEATISVSAGDEDVSIKQVAKETGDAEDFITSVKKNLKNSKWGWCCATIRATYKGFTGSAYLGQCSYLNKEDFIANSGYYDQLVAEAVENLNEDILLGFTKVRDLIQVGE